ncbi:MAG: hypothetical protein OSJ72_20485 [Lachnospiraceae bacterium]|nr:hypothetical protein [Lachnospiraceae bacterium]
MNNKSKRLREIMPEVTVLVSCLLLLTGCGMKSDPEAAKAALEENTVSINLDEMAEDSDPIEKSEKYRDYLERITVEDFADQEGIEAADAVVSYDEETEQYSVEVSLKTNGKVDSGQIEDYKTYLSKSFSAVTLVVDGEVV